MIDFSVARFKHLNWVFRIRCFLDKQEMLTLEQAISHEQCDLGKWILSKEVEKYRQVEEFKELENIHERLHLLVREIISLKNEANLIESEKKYKELKPISNRIVELLTVIEKMITKPNPVLIKK